MEINLLKCHGSNNDFIIIDEFSNDYNFTDEHRIFLTKELCERGKLIGSDGTLFIQKSDVADAKMRMFNTDGSEAEMCGNGLRCVARYVIDLLNKEHVIVETLKANLDVNKVADIHENVPTYEVLIAPASFDISTLPMNKEGKGNTLVKELIQGLYSSLTFTAVSVPNPHIITIVDDVDEAKVKEIGEKANEDKDTFPNGVNVSFVRALGDSTIYVQTYERGVGITNACGTAMSASSLVSCVLGINNYHEDILVLNKGGMVRCHVKEEDGDNFSVMLKGNATYTFKNTIDFDPSAMTLSNMVEVETFQQEIDDYSQLQDAAKEILANRLSGGLLNKEN